MKLYNIFIASCRMLTMAILLRYVLWDAIGQVRRPKNEFTPLRMRLLGFVILIVLLLIPGLLRLLGVNINTHLTGILTNIGVLFAIILLAQVYQFKPNNTD